MSQPKPTYAVLRSHYPTIEIKRPELYKSIGWDDLIDDAAYHNTCATRMSIALLGAGYNFPGRMRINAGPLKGRMIEPGQSRLSAILARRDYFGAPDIFKGERATRDGIGRRSGLLSFFNVDADDPNNRQGHMDLVSAASGGPMCAGTCFLTARETWFWPLR